MKNIDENKFQAFLKEMLHPVRCRLFVEVSARKEATAGELAQVLSDVPQASLYRHLNALVEQGVLAIVAQHKKRALYENVYAVSIDFGADIDEMLKNNRGDVYAAMFFQYMMVFLKEFEAYAARPGIDIQNDGSGFSLSPVSTTGEELVQLMTQINEVLEPYRVRAHAPDGERRTHTIGLIITPPKETE